MHFRFIDLHQARQFAYFKRSVATVLLAAILLPSSFALNSTTPEPHARATQRLGGAGIRHVRIDDLFQSVAVINGGQSPNGAAFVLSTRQGPGTLGSAKLWLKKSPSDPAQVISESPLIFVKKWSPGGRYVAFCRFTKPGLHEIPNRLGILDSETGLAQEFDLPGSVSLIEWINEDRFVCQTYPPDMFDGTRDILPVAWAKQAAGLEPTASVLASGVPVEAFIPLRRLFVVERATGSAIELRTGQQFTKVQVSPNRRYLAFFRQVSQEPVYQPRDDEAIPTMGIEQPEKLMVSFLPKFPRRTLALEILDLDGKVLFAGTPQPTDDDAERLGWAPDGSTVYFWNQENFAGSESFLSKASVSGGGAKRVELGNLGSISEVVHWTATGSPVVFGKDRLAQNKAENTERWWVIHRDGKRSDLTPSINIAPGTLVSGNSATHSYGVSDGRLWRIPMTDKVEKVDEIEVITSGVAKKLTGFMPVADIPSGAKFWLLNGETGEDDNATFLFDVSSSTLSQIKRPAATATVFDFKPQTGGVTWLDHGRLGIRIWTGARGAGPELALHFNGWVKDVAEGQTRMLKYRSLDGEALEACLLLPAGYEEGKRYPVITWVYAGTADVSFYQHLSVTGMDWLNLQVAAAQGYAVLFPSMPLAKWGKLDDPLLKLTNGVLPAVEAAVAGGFADPNRIVVAGHSFGGYSTMGLLTQTRRFRAGISLCGISDLISGYVGISDKTRYAENVHNNLIALTWAETGQAQMGSVPWSNLGKYLRNSPITYVDRVETPLLLIHGDLDRAGSSNLLQSEEFFRFLHRRGKRAELVRYWGEDHVFQSPANIRDVWARIFAWCDEFADVARDPAGKLLWEGNHAMSRKGAAPLKPDELLKLDAFFDQNFGKFAP